MAPPKNETLAQRRQRLDRNYARRRQKEMEETPEQKRRRLDRLNADRKARNSERELRLAQNREQRQERERTETTEEQQQRLDKEKELNRLKKVKAEKSRFNYMVRTITMTDEKKEKQRRRQYFYWQANRQRILQVQRLWRESLTGEKKERYLESVRRSLKKQQDNTEKREKFKQYLRQRYASETPEQTLQRRRKDKMNDAKRKLRRSLEQLNTSQKETEFQLKQLGEKMWKEFYPEGDVPMPVSTMRRRVPRMNSLDVRPTNIISSRTTSERPDVLCEADEDCINTEQVLPDPYTPENLGSLTSVLSPPSSPPMDMVEEVEPGHLNTTSTTTPLSCPHCLATLSSDQQVRSHLVSLHSDKCWKCPKCGVVVLSSLELSQHYSTVHKRTTGICKGVSGNWNFLCLKCPPGQLERFGRREVLLAHVQKRHPSQFWPCSGCQLLKYSEHALHLHQTVCVFVAHPKIKI